jgi:hypothetical protein
MTNRTCGWNLDDVRIAGTRTHTPPDASGDGMADAWQIDYFGTTNALADADPDQDGFSNLAEYLAGTNPTNGQSCLRTGIESAGEQPVARIPTSRSAGAGYAGLTRYYRLEYTTNLLDPRWRVVPGCSNILGDDSTFRLTNTAPDGTGFYRVNAGLR